MFMVYIAVAGRDSAGITREAQENDIINVSYIRTEEQMADGFTKALQPSRFQFLRESIGISE